MTKIFMQFEETRKVAGQYSKHASDIEELLSSLKMSQVQLASSWAGKGFEQFQVQFEELVPNIISFQQLLTDISKFLTQSANVLEEADNRIMASIRGDSYY